MLVFADICVFLRLAEYNRLCPGGPSTYVDEVTGKIIGKYQSVTLAIGLGRFAVFGPYMFWTFILLIYFTPSPTENF